MPSAWVQHVQSVYRKKKAKNAKYTYGQAMKDAKATYKKKGAAKAEKQVDEKQADAAPKKRRRKKKSLSKKADFFADRPARATVNKADGRHDS